MGTYLRMCMWPNQKDLLIQCIMIMFTSFERYSMDLNKLLEHGMRDSPLICYNKGIEGVVRIKPCLYTVKVLTF